MGDARDILLAVNDKIQNDAAYARLLPSLLAYTLSPSLSESDKAQVTSLSKDGGFTLVKKVPKLNEDLEAAKEIEMSKRVRLAKLAGIDYVLLEVWSDVLAFAVLRSGMSVWKGYVVDLVSRRKVLLVNRGYGKTEATELKLAISAKPSWLSGTGSIINTSVDTCVRLAGAAIGKLFCGSAMLAKHGIQGIFGLFRAGGVFMLAFNVGAFVIESIIDSAISTKWKEKVGKEYTQTLESITSESITKAIKAMYTYFRLVYDLPKATVYLVFHAERMHEYVTLFVQKIVKFAMQHTGLTIVFLSSARARKIYRLINSSVHSKAEELESTDSIVEGATVPLSFSDDDENKGSGTRTDPYIILKR